MGRLGFTFPPHTPNEAAVDKQRRMRPAPMTRLKRLWGGFQIKLRNTQGYKWLAAKHLRRRLN